jgi:class 3 adenylate cyclase
MNDVAEPESDPLVLGRAALAVRNWPAVFSYFSEVEPAAMDDAELEGLFDAAEAVWQLDRMIEVCELAYKRYVESGNTAKAAWMAMRRAIGAAVLGDYAVMGGWMATAQQFLADEPDCEAQALVSFIDYHVFLNSGDLDGALESATKITKAAKRAGSRDLELMGQQYAGQALARRGDVDEGMAMIDSAMAAAVSGQVGPFARGQIMCQTLTACQRLGDFGRAFQWLESIERTSVVHGYEGSADCKIHRAGILKLQGSWARAEAEARDGCGHHPNDRHVGWGWCEIGEIHLRQGDLEGAEEAFGVAYEKGYVPHPGLALLYLAQDDVPMATASIDQAYQAAGNDLGVLVPLLSARTDIALAAGDVATARASADELQGAAAACGSVAYLATAACADGAVTLAEGDPAAAEELLCAAIDRFLDVGMPYETAAARVTLAAARLKSGDRGRAKMDLRAARSGFERLGAELDAARVVALLDDLTADRKAADEPVTATKTFMFTDIERSTLLLEALGDRAWDDLLQWHDRTLRDAMSVSGGTEVKHEGDGFFMAFDTAQAAIECACSIQRNLSEHRHAHGFSPRVRVGLHAGTATERDGDYFGMAVNTTARVMSLAIGDQIMATASTVPTGLAIGQAEDVWLKGVKDPVTVVEVLWR